MPKVSVYLPDDLAAEVRRRGLPLSALTQQAVEAAIRAADRERWVTRMREAPLAERTDVDVSALMSDVRSELEE